MRVQLLLLALQMTLAVACTFKYPLGVPLYGVVGLSVGIGVGIVCVWVDLQRSRKGKRP